MMLHRVKKSETGSSLGILVDGVSTGATVYAPSLSGRIPF
jgi:hypothetical protein